MKNLEIIIESKYHSSLVNSIIRRYIIAKSTPNKIDDIIRKYLKIHFEKYEKIKVILLLKLLTSSNQIEYIRIQRSSSHKICLPNAFFFSRNKIIQEQLYSQILELRITFVSRFENIRFDHYLTKPKSMLEWKLLAMFDKNPEIVHSFDYKRYNHPLFREFFDIYLDDSY